MHDVWWYNEHIQVELFQNHHISFLSQVCSTWIILSFGNISNYVKYPGKHTPGSHITSLIIVKPHKCGYLLVTIWKFFKCWKIPRWVEKLSFMFTSQNILWMLKNSQVSRKDIFINLHFSYYNLTAQVWLSVGGCLEMFQMLKNSQVSRKVIFHVHIWVIW